MYQLKKMNLMQCSNDEFFTNYEKHFICQVPSKLKNILKINGYNNAYALSNFNENSTTEMERYMQQEFNSEMLREGQTITEFLGIYEKIQMKFKFVSGEKALIQKIAEECQKLYKADEPEESTSSPQVFVACNGM